MLTKKMIRSGQILAAVAAIGLLAGCGSDDDTSSTTNQADAATTTTAEKQLTGEPIKVGFQDPSRGGSSYPEAGPGAKGAEHYVNTVLGGVDGRPIELVTCDHDGTPEAAVSCANKFAEAKVVAVVDGNSRNNGAGLDVLHSAKIPMVGNTAQDAISVADQKSFFFGPAQPVYAIAPLQHYKQAGKKKVALMQPDTPVGHEYIDSFMAPVAKNIGIDFAPVYYDDANPNWTVLAATMKSTNADVVGTIALPEGQCTEMIKALKGAGYTGEIFAGGCTDFVNELGDQAEGTTIYSAVWLPIAKPHADPETQKQIDGFTASMKATGSDAQGLYAVMAFTSVVTLRDVLATIDGTIDGPAVSKALKATTDLDTFMGPTINCDHSVWPGQSACSNQLQMLGAQADKSFKPLNDPPFIAVSPSLAPSR